MSRSCAKSLFVLSLVLAAHAQPVSAQKLDVKPGLWEVSMAQPKSVTQVCYTADVLSGGITQFTAPPGLDCKSDVVQETPRVVVTRTVCTGAMSMEGETRMDIASREAMTMQSTAVMSMGGSKQTIKASATYKWLGADCGNVRPFDPKDQIR